MALVGLVVTFVGFLISAASVGMMSATGGRLVMVGLLRSLSILTLTAGCSLATLVAARLFGGPAPERVMGWWGRAFLRLGDFRVRVEGMEGLPPGGAVLVSNHQSLVDIPLLLAAFRRPVKFLAKRELGEIPLFGRAMAFFFL